MRLTLGTRGYDLSNRALVIGALGAPGDPIAHGADIVERADQGPLPPVPVFALAPDDAAVEQALLAGARLVRLPAPTAAALSVCASAGAAVVIPPGAAEDARAAGLSAERVVPDSLLIDVTGQGCPVAATAVGVVRGARLVRTADVRGARRICDVIAAVLAAR